MAAAFHGHLGPWLALGLRAGIYARRHLLDDPFRLEAVVRCPGRRPFTCFIDGVQFGSGCTLGKSNIHHVPSRSVGVTFRVAGKPGLTLNVTAATARSIRLPDEDFDAVARLGRAVFRRPLRELFRVG
jgi:formylmethanofuran dehydrogenase subunit E